MTQKNSVRLIDRKTLLNKVPVSYPIIWKMMRDGIFPRGREIGGRTFWIESEVDDFINGRPARQLKGEEVVA
jgi:predicted DNA-binding transcriptional regulator AlpA